MKERSRLIKIILPFALAVLIALCAELLLGAKSLAAPKTAKSFPAETLSVTGDPTEGRERYKIDADVLTPVNGTVRRTFEDPVWLLVPLDSAYYNHLFVETDGERDVFYTLLLDTWSIYGQEKFTEKDDLAAEELGLGISHFSDKVENLYLEFESTDLDCIRSITVMNRYEFSWQRFLLLLAAAVSVALLACFKELLLKRLEIVYFVIALSFGTALLFSHGFMPNSWDEQVHFSCTYQMSCFGQVSDSKAYEDYYQLQYPPGDTPDEQGLLADYADANSAEIAKIAPDYPYTTVFGRVGYVFQALGMAFARLLGLSFTAQIYMANLWNLLCYVCLTTLAVKWCRFGKYALFFVALMPVQFVLATSFSYDAFVNAFMMLGYALFTAEYADDGPLNRKRTILGIAVMAVGILPKAVYFPLLFLWCFLPKSKFSQAKYRYLFYAAVAVCAIFLAATFVGPAVLGGSGGTDLYSDPRRPAANTSLQLSLLLHHPFKYFRLLFSNILNWQLPYYFGDLVWTNFVYPGRYVGTGRYLVPILFTFIAMTQGTRGELPEEKPVRLRAVKIGGLILMFVAECFVWTALYLAFNPVGAERIKGVQGRYLIPVTFLMFLLFYNKKIRFEISEAIYRRIIAGSAVYICFISMWVVYFGNEWYNVI